MDYYINEFIEHVENIKSDSEDKAIRAIERMATMPCDPRIITMLNLLPTEGISSGTPLEIKACWALGEIGDPWPEHQLIEVLYKRCEKTSELQMALVSALGKIGSCRAIYSIFEISPKNCPEIEEIIVEALTEIGRNHPEEIWQLTGGTGTPSTQKSILLKVIFRLLKMKSLHETVQDQVSDFIVECLKDPKCEVKSNALQIFRRYPKQFSLHELYPMLDDCCYDIQGKAARILSENGDVSGFKSMIKREVPTNDRSWKRAIAKYPEVAINAVRSLIEDMDTFGTYCYESDFDSYCDQTLIEMNICTTLKIVGTKEALDLREEFPED